MMLGLFLLACEFEKAEETDNDGDGYDASVDCNDNDASMPAFDQDCDGASTGVDCDDEDATSTTMEMDLDCDGVVTEEDCDDNDANSNVQSEDGDCDGIRTEEDCDDSEPLLGASSNDADCDGITTVEDCNDSDPSSTALAVDADCDGVLTADDCDDSDPSVSELTEYLFMDTFVQNTNQTDIVFAVDSSSGMMSTIANLIDDFSAFVSTLNSNGHDYQISGVTNDDGCVTGSVLSIDNSFSASQAENIFSDMLTTTNAYGSNSERAFTLMEAFLDEAVDNSGVPLTSGCNSGAIREHAQLALVGVSDEPEQSIEPYTYYLNEFQSLKNDPNDVTFYGIGQVSSACSGSTYSGMSDAISATGGVLYDICTTDFTSAFENMASEVSDDTALGVFPLSNDGSNATEFSILVDGQPVLEGWEYRVLDNSMVFSASSLPQAGAVIEVTYGGAECL